jgi:hypothetical protein
MKRSEVAAQTASSGAAAAGLARGAARGPVRSGSRAPQRSAASRSRAVAIAGLLCLAALIWGHRLREELYFTPKAPLGYGLGIFGTGCMVLLLLYSVRKRVRALAPFGSIRTWFQLHMILGLVGPTAILFHCNFQVGSVNSGVALACVLLVAGSGLIGRFLYPRIHHGLSGRRATLAERRDELETRRGALAVALATAPELSEALRRFEAAAVAPAGDAARAWQLVAAGHRARRMRRQVGRVLRRQGTLDRRALRDALREVGEYVGSVRQVTRFRFYEHVFGLWHALHLPLCVLLFAAAAVHVVAVNMY